MITMQGKRKSVFQDLIHIGVHFANNKTLVTHNTPASATMREEGGDVFFMADS